MRWPALAALAPVLLTAGCLWGGPGADDPLVILVSIDTLRADHVGLLGAEHATTPQIDAYFGDATVFTQASTSAPCTIPAVRQFLSGGHDLAPDRPRLAEVLHDHGFRTVASTSQHMFVYDADGGYSRGFDRFETQGRDELDAYGMSTRSGEDVVDRAIALLHGWPWQGGPTFLWVHLFDPHDPYEIHAGYPSFDQGNTSTRSGDRRAALQAERPNEKWAWMEAGHIFTPEDVAHLRNLYDGEIAYADAQLGRLFDHLQTTGLDRQAIVVLIADHGEWLGEDDAWDHCRTLHGRELHVPFFVRDHGGRLGGIGRSDAPVSTLDVLPTVLARLGIDLPAGSYHGTDLAHEPAPTRPVVSMWRSRKAVRDGQYKLVVRDDVPHALYDLTADPDEAHDVSDAHPDVVARLLDALHAVPELEDRVGKENEDTMGLLELLGYVDDAEAKRGADDATEPSEAPSQTPPPTSP
ncbi:MAG: sulfatase [Alphaproteobacteria bacterium]|nr:sulfatase [Alphaproteobacteria bacterium]